MIIQHNIPAWNSHRQLGLNNAATAKNLEKLSSGYRINRAGDDAAGLAISEKMRGQIRGLAMAEMNVANGISLIQTAEGGLQETHAILQRMRELAVQSANGTYDNDVDRHNLNKEVDALKLEIDRISTSTHYNGINLLDGSLGGKIASNNNPDYKISKLTLDAFGQSVSFSYAFHGDFSQHLGPDSSDYIWADGSGSRTLGSARLIFSNTATTNIGGIEYCSVFFQMRDHLYQVEADSRLYYTDASGQKKWGIEFDSRIWLDPAKTSGGTVGNFFMAENANREPGSSGTTVWDGLVDSSDYDGVVIAGQNSRLEFQIGANGYADQRVGLHVANMSTANLGSKEDVLFNISIATQEDARSAIDVINGAINMLSSTRADLGALQNRLEHTSKNLGVTKENLQAAESVIRDVDMAKEMMEFQKNQILVQAAQAMLSQANALPQGVLGLLR